MVFGFSSTLTRTTNSLLPFFFTFSIYHTLFSDKFLLIHSYLKLTKHYFIQTILHSKNLNYKIKLGMLKAS